LSSFHENSFIIEPET